MAAEPKTEKGAIAIIGAGPAGVQAAAVLSRKLSEAVFLFEANAHTLRRCILPPTEIVYRADENRVQIQMRLDRPIKIHEGVTIKRIKAEGNGFLVYDMQGRRWSVKKVILAVGSASRRSFPQIEGYPELWERKIYYDPFNFERNGNALNYQIEAGVLAVGRLAESPTLALQMAAHLKLWEGEVRCTIFTDGSEELTERIKIMTSKAPGQYVIEDRKISKLKVVKEESMTAELKVEFTKGKPVWVHFLFHSPHSGPRGPFVANLGLKTTASGDIQADASYQTSVRGVFAAGDCGATHKLAPFAAASGQIAGMAALLQLQADTAMHDSILDV